MSQAGYRQASIRAVTGSSETYEGDWHRLFDLAAIPAGPFEGRMLRWINIKLSAAYTSLPEAQQALATANGAFNFAAMGTFDASTASGAPPANTLAPALSGIQTQGQTLATTNGSWSGSPAPTFTYQWKRDGSSIAAATAQTYVLQAADVGKAILCAVTATNANGSASANSNSVTPAATLTISGTPGGATTDSAYSFTPTTAGGHAPYSYSLTGTLPTGLSFNTSTGAITGTPTSAGTTSGLNITVTDADGLTASLGAFSLVVTNPSPGTGDVIALTVLDATAPVTSPTNNIDGSGWVAAVTFKGMAAGQTLDPSKISFTVSEPGFDSTGAATTVTRTITATKALRRPLYGALWASGTTYTAGSSWSNYVYTKTGGSNTTRIYRCTAAGGGTSTVQPTHTSGSVTGADVYTWLFVSNTTQSDVPPQAAVEVVSGSDVIVYVALDKAVSSGINIDSVNIQAGAYGSSNASRSYWVTKTNNSTFAAYKPDVAWITPPWQLLRSGDTIPIEIAAIHGFGQSGRTVAAVKFTVYDNSNVATSVTSTVTSMTQSTVLTTALGNPVPVFAWSLSQATLAAAGLADGMYSVRAEVFPFMGAKWDSDTDGFGSTGTWSISTVMPANNAKRIPFELDSDNSKAIYYAAVDGVGAGTPAVSTTEATAKTTPYATIVAAANALQAAAGNLAHQVIDIIGGTTLTGFGATMDSGSSKTYGTGWLTIRKYPGDAGVATINADTVTSANRVCGKRTKFYDVTLVGGASVGVIANGENGTTAGLVAHEMWFDKCVLTGTGSQAPLQSSGWFTITNSTLNSTAAMLGNTRNVWAFLGGSTVSAGGVSTGAPVQAINALGNKMTNKATIGNPISRYWNDNSQAVASSIWAFNTWYNCTQNVVWALKSTGTGGSDVQYTVGASWAQNLIEANDAAAKGGEIGADAQLMPIPRVWDLFNTAAGDGQNFLYNESTTTQIKKIGVARFNALRDRNSKSDWWDNQASANAARPERTGNWFGRYGVDWLANGVTNATNTTPSPSNLGGEVLESRSFLSGTAGFTSDRSKVGTGAGNGDYRPTSSSSYKGMVGATEQIFPFDLNGTTRKTDGTGACGAFEWA